MNTIPEKASKLTFKKAYTAPVLLASDVRIAAANVCGWWTQCGKQVKCDR